jgi:hypothetical protein
MVSQIELISAIFTELDRQDVKSLVPRQTNAIIRCVNEIIREIEIEPVSATPGMGLTAWLNSDDVGLSSRYMAAVLSGRFFAENHYPRDADDFGRCVRLLDAVPGFRDRLPEMHEHGAEWSRLVRYWNKAEDRYREGDLKACNDLVAAAIGGQ